MYDRFQRKIDYMRISITDRCNLRCRYCMPEGVNLIPMEELLRYEEICEICHQAVKLGITKFKITGGEPLVRRGCADLIRRIKAIDGVEQVTLTSNGILLKEKIKELKAAGLDGINISLDTLMEDKYEEITKFPMLHQVLEGIEEALKEEFPVKINCVLQKGVNDQEWKNLVELARDKKVHVRFIELMPIGDGKEEEMISNQWILQSLKEEYGEIEADERVLGNGPAIYYHIPGFQGSIGLISAIHGKFCEHCNRIRMTSTGQIKPCLCFEKSFDIRDAVRKNEKERIRAILEEAIQQKPQMHCFEDYEEITEHKKMVQIGG